MLWLRSRRSPSTVAVVVADTVVEVEDTPEAAVIQAVAADRWQALAAARPQAMAAVHPQ
ncbi:MAG: hypothetical protein ACRD59_12590 [Candidatus Acidiferrales bacterium]